MRRAINAGSAPGSGLPAARGLYSPRYERDSCGVGFVCDIKGRASRAILDDANRINCRMGHRGGIGCEPGTGDGAGLLTGLPHRLLDRVAREQLGISLPPPGQYGVGIAFLPRNRRERRICKERTEAIIVEQGQRLLGWRRLPHSAERAGLTPTVIASMPHLEQLFVGAGEGFADSAFERQLYIIRKYASHCLRGDPRLSGRELPYFCSLSTNTVIYKGMLTPHQLFEFFDDLRAADYESHMAMVHSRFSTNTFPSWDRAQPNRAMCHNGEINTLLGNCNWMNAREGVLHSELFGDELEKLFPIIEPNCSDSGNFDNVLEFLLMTGRSLPESIMTMIPEAWQQRPDMPADKRAFYEFQSCLMEPWDGPALIPFADGHCIGAVLDRNGLRPSRYYVTDDDRCVMASEVGVLPMAPERVVKKGRLHPGRLFLIDFDAGRLVPDHELKSEWARQRPYGEWLARQRLELGEADDPRGYDEATVLGRMRAFGYTTETLQFMLLSLVRDRRDPLGSMGNDAELAALSDRPRMLYDYFKQRFAQVTNPAIDSIREEVVMSLECYIGPEGNLLEVSEEHAHRLRLPHPILSNRQFAALARLEDHGWRCRTLDATFARGSGKRGLLAALGRLEQEADRAVEEGFRLLVLSDRAIGADRLAISSLLAVGCVHHHLVRTHQRTRIALIVETGESREVHHHCLLLGYGADAINPYLAYESLWRARRAGRMDDYDHIDSDDDVVAAYRKGVGKGILKVMAKMGISTLQSYKGAQIFEAVGLGPEVVNRCFTDTESRVGGIGFGVLAEEIERRHELGFAGTTRSNGRALPNPGDFHWRKGGARHMWDPVSVRGLRVAARTNSREAYWRFARHANEENTRRATLRGLLRFRPTGPPVDLDQVEPEAAIVRRFATGAMSFGSISKEAHESLALAMNHIGARSNSGEGGEDPARNVPDPDGGLRRSAIKQVASGRFGVTIEYLTAAEELQIKIVQGAKPGEGGELPGRKVDDYIASIRHSTPGVGLISPPPHHDIYSIEDIAQLIHDLKNANPQARISVKLCAEIGVGTVAAGVVKARADHLVISGDSGGTGASPLTSIKHAGLPWELGIAEVHQTLVMNNLRSRVIVQTDGQLKTGRDVAVAALLGAEEFGFSTAPLITLGCVMMRKCHLNTCPVGVATQDPELRKKFSGKPEYIINYLFMVARELREIMARLGFRTVNEMIGRVDALRAAPRPGHWKARSVNVDALLMPALEPPDCLGVYCRHEQDHGLEDALDHTLIRLAGPAIEEGRPVRHDMAISNGNRVVGGMLSNHIIRRAGPGMLPDGSIHFRFRGSAGQSFGAWLARGVTLEVEGDANDYVGKGLSGGRIILYPPRTSRFKAEENILVGNVVFYGAISGEGFFRGIAAERFCVRNSGATAVVEGIGDHGCEYMTGGRVVVLGQTGINFAAGMSGGIAYVWDPEDAFERRCNMDLVVLERLSDAAEREELRRLIERHREYTGSTVAAAILGDWDARHPEFAKVVPIDYKRALEERAAAGHPHALPTAAGT